VTTFRCFVSRFQYSSLFEIFSNNREFFLAESLVINDVVFKHVDHPFKVVFAAGTKVQRNDMLTDIPAHEFRFKPFKEIEDRNSYALLP